jgi:hypothetical protein
MVLAPSPAAARGKKKEKPKAPETEVAAPTPAPAPPPPQPVAAAQPAPPAPAQAPAAPAEPDAQAAPEAVFGFDIEPAFVLPIGNLADAAGIGFGGLVGMRRPVAKQLEITARAGFVYHLSKDYGAGSAGISEVPILGGVRYTFVPTASGGFYGGAELGLSIVFARASTSVDGLVGPQSSSTSDTKASTALGVGYRAGMLDVRGAMYFIDLGHMGDSMTAMATVGFTFAEL